MVEHGRFAIAFFSLVFLFVCCSFLLKKPITGHNLSFVPGRCSGGE